MKQTLFSIVLIAILIYSEVVYAAHVSVGKRNKEMHQKLSEQELSGLAVKMPPGISGERGAVPPPPGRREAAQQIPLGFPGKREAIELANSKPIDGHPEKRDLVKKQRKIANEEYPASEVANSPPCGGGRGKREAVQEKVPPGGMQAS